MPSVIQKFIFNPFQENTLVIHDDTTCVIVDPGCYEEHEYQELTHYIEKNDLNPSAILLTHAHIDHVLGCDFLAKKYNIPFYLHEKDLPTLNGISEYAHVYGFQGYRPPASPDILLQGDEILEFGEMKFKVLFTPGHCPGHVVYYNENDKYVVNGDVLFAGSFGRVDLPGGDMETLKNSIFKVMFNLPDQTVVYCGHGPETTIGAEKKSNFIHQF